MKSAFHSFSGCMVLLFCFSSCAYNFFPKKLVYTVAEASTGLPYDSMQAEGYKNDLHFLRAGKLLANFTVVGPPGGIPKPPGPCDTTDSTTCHPFTFTFDNTNYFLSIEGYKTLITMKPIDVSEYFIAAIKKSPNQQFILKVPQYKGN